MATPLTLEYSEFGSGEPLLILHGLFGNGRNWRTLAKQFSKKRHVYLVDMRNHGRSPWDKDMSYAAMVADVAAFIQHHALGKVDVVGHSMGGKTAMTLALTHPELVRRVVSVDIAPVSYSIKMQGYFGAMRSLDISGKLSRPQMQSALDSGTHSSGVSMFLLQNLAHTEQGYRWRLNLDVLEGALAAEITKFPIFDHSWDGQILFLDGETSSYIRDRHHREMTRLFPSMRIAQVDAGGHWLHAENPTQTHDLITQFLDAA